MPWFKVDDSFPSHPKVLKIPRRERPAAIGLWTLAGAWCAQQLTDGHLGAHLIAEFGASAKSAQALVDSELWDATEQGFYFHDWEDWQPTRAAVESERSAARERMRKARERRSSPEQQPNTDRSSPAVAVALGSLTPTRPDPTRRELVVEEVSQVQANGDLRDDLVDLETIARATHGDHHHARRVARDVLAKAKTRPTDPTAFVLTAVRADPARHRANAPTTRARCPEHDLDLPCGACAADRKVGT